MKPNNNKQQAFIRLLALVLVLLNQALTTFDINPLPFSDEQLYEWSSYVVLTAVAVWNWWKHANVTKESQVAQVELERLKKKK